MDYSTILILGFLAISLCLDITIARVSVADAFGDMDDQEFDETHGDTSHDKSAWHQDNES